MQRWTGTSVPRVEDPRLLTGRGRYVDDLLPDGTLHVAFVRSPWPHAALGAVDCTEARALPGVVAVWSAADIGDAIAVRPADQGPDGLAVPEVEPMCTDRVRFAGDLVAMVVATSRAIAEDAAELVLADYEPLEPIVLLDDALDDTLPPIFASLDSNVLYDQTFRHGDPDLHFAGAARVVRRSLRRHRQACLPLEGRAILARWNGGHLTVDAAFENPLALRASYTELLGLDESRVTVRRGDVGGSFGQKADAMREEVLVAHAARVLGRPVKWIEDRTENLLAAGHAHDETLHVAAAVDLDGRIRAVRVSTTVDAGAYPPATRPVSIVPALARVLFAGPYAIDHLRFDARVCVTNKGPSVASRDPWEAGTFARERLLDAIAHDLDLDPVEVRLVNLVPPDAFPRAMVTGPVPEHELVLDTMERAFARLDLDATRAQCEAARAGGVRRGVGFAVVLEGQGVAFEDMIAPGGWTQATHACVVEVDGDTGHVEILRYVVAEGCGELVDPRVVDSRIRGGVARAIAGVLLERIAYADDGQPLTTTLLDYLPPFATDLPLIEIEHIEQGSLGDHEHPGLGGGGAIGVIGASAALVAAIEDALAGSDVQITDQHLPPRRIHELIRTSAP